MTDEQYVRAVVTKQSAYVNATAGLQSLLYDVDLLPEQMLHTLNFCAEKAAVNSARMDAICQLWRKAHP